MKQNRYLRKVWIVLYVVLLFSINGCATLQLTKEELSKIPLFLVVRTAKPDIFLKTETYISSSEGVDVESNTSSLNVDSQLHNISQLIVDTFIKRVYDEIPYWPKMKKNETPIKVSKLSGRVLPDGVNYILGFDISRIILHQKAIMFTPSSDISIRILGAVTMVDPNGNLMFIENILYHSKHYKRYIARKDFKSKDKNKYLKKEIDFAVEKIVLKLIESLKNKKQKVLRMAI